MSYIKQSDLIEQKEIDDMNDATSWYHSKFDEMLLEIATMSKEELYAVKSGDVFADRKADYKKGLWLRRQIFHAQDIKKVSIGSVKVSIAKDPDFFSVPMDKLKQTLLSYTYPKSKYFKYIEITDDEIFIKDIVEIAEKSLSIDYYVQINKNPQTEPRDLKSIVEWGLF
jgi:hypothetical protein